MKKEIEAILLATASLILIFTPFYLPDSYIYVKKCESIYNPVFNIVGYISIYILVWLALYKLYELWYKILNKE